MELPNNFDNQDLIPQQKNENVAVPNDELADQRRLPKLIATGEMPFPSGLSQSETDLLAIEVSRLRRVRLVRYIAREIARDIERNQNHK
jgi:hypothetical protein